MVFKMTIYVQTEEGKQIRKQEAAEKDGNWL